MSKVGRNESCPCGSGRKAKRCCGVERGPSEESLARAFLSLAAQDGARSVSHLCEEELVALFDGLWELPVADLSLQVQLPQFFTPQLSRLGEAVADEVFSTLSAKTSKPATLSASKIRLVRRL